MTVLFVWGLSSLWIFPINFWSLIEPKTELLALNVTEISINEDDKCTTDFETNKLFKIVSTLFNFYIPLLGMILIYSKIFLTITERSKSELGKINVELEQHSNSSIQLQNQVDPCFRNRKSISESAIGSRLKYNRSEIIHKKPDCEFKCRQTRISSRSLGKPHISIRLKQNLKRKRPETISGKQQASNKKGVQFNLMNLSYDSDIDKLQKNGCFRKSFIGDRRNGVIRYNFLRKMSRNFLNRQNSKPLSPTMPKPIKHSIRLSQQIKAAKQLGILLLAFLCTWMPYFVIFIVVAFCPECIPENIYLLTVWLGYFNSSINPILYPLCNSSFKNAFRKMFHLSYNQYDQYKLVKILNSAPYS